MKREQDDWEARNMIHKDVRITFHSPQIDITGNKLSRTSPTQSICIFFQKHRSESMLINIHRR